MTAFDFRLAHLIEPTKRALYGWFGCESDAAARVTDGRNVEARCGYISIL
jgi:hypothetical protein